MDTTKNTINNSGQPQTPISPSEKDKKIAILRKWLFIGFGGCLVVIMLAFSIYLIPNLKKPFSGTNQGNSNLVTTPTQEERVQPTKIYKLEEIFTPEEKISSSQVAPNNTYAFVVTQKTTPVGNTFKVNENGPVILVRDNLIFVNLITKEKREFDLYDLASKEIIDPLKTVPVQTQYTLYVTPLKWSANSNDFWGAINLVSSDDPPVNESVSLFKINSSDLTVERYPLPGNYINTLGPQNLNLDRNAVLFESATPKNELYLYDYSILTKSKTTIVSYPNGVFSKYLPGEYGFLGYYHPWFAETESRQLNAKWLDKDTISYIDFVTRQEVIKKIE